MDPKHSHGPDRIDYREDPGDLSEVHAAILRENPEPSAAVTPIPLWLITICGIAVAWAGAYLGMFNGGFRGDIFNERLSSPDLLFPHVAKSTGPGRSRGRTFAGRTGQSGLRQLRSVPPNHRHGPSGNFPAARQVGNRPRRREADDCHHPQGPHRAVPGQRRPV